MFYAFETGSNHFLGKNEKLSEVKEIADRWKAASGNNVYVEERKTVYVTTTLEEAMSQAGATT